MSLFLVTGTSGTGKTTVCDALKERHYEAYDIDDDGLARWQNIKSGYIHPKSSVKPSMRTPEFITDHAWVVPRERLQTIAEASPAKPVFISGSLDNIDNIYDLFDRIFALYVDDETLIHRLQTRTTNDWGKQPHELAQSLRHHHRIYDEHRQRGDILVDSSQPPEVVVAKILSLAR